MPAYFTHITPVCRSEAQKHGVLADVEKLREKIERTQDVGNLSPFPRIFRKKSLGKSYRLLMGEVPYEGDIDARLLVFWHVWPKSSPDYSAFSRDSQSFEDDFHRDCESLSPPLDAIWEEKLQSAPPEIWPQSLSQEEYKYLYGVRRRDGRKDDWIVLESETWIERTDPEKSSKPNNLSTRLSVLPNIILQAILNVFEKDEGTNFLDDGNGTAILYKALPAEKMIFLVAPLRAGDQDDRAQLESKYRGVLRVTEKSKLMSDVRRSYPSMVLVDTDLWERIQKSNEKANLSLSPEEAEVLRNGRDGHYPLFINGRPGSGKSTILQYLFADHLYDYLPFAVTLQAPPLYLTYSQDLLRAARDVVEAILKSNAYHRLREDALDLGKIDALVQNSFYTLKDYLYKLLPENEKEKFPEKGYLHFPEFRLWYEKTFGRDASLNGISAELAWHVIRSYIKGLSSDSGEYLDDVEEFEELPGAKSVTLDTFRRVSRQIWPRYQKMCQENSYWDDQDLVRAVLTGWAEKTIDVPEHAAVFCDEAQDYSLNELRFIFRLSLYARRRLTPDILNRLPFAFAGDPFQTLNPTGFDWDAIRGNFGLTIRELLYSKRGHPVLQPTELTFNYRSSADIVQLCNFIHLMRGLAFGKKGLKPQKSWEKAYRTPVYFDADSVVFRSTIQEQRETVIILPCQEGEEQHFVENDPFLSDFGIRDGVLARNILSPMRAKGLEYKRVVLYKFGDACVKHYPELLDLLDKEQSAQKNAEQLLSLEYFINRLYVAASRAQRRLIIADTKPGLEDFWKKYFEKTDLQQWIDAYCAFDSSDRWKKDQYIGKVHPGRKEDWEGDRDDPLLMAKDFETRGFANKDTSLLQLAANNYRDVQHESDALRCDAKRLEFEENFVEAGKIWQTLGEQDKAKELYWKAQAFEHLSAFEDQSLQKHAAQFMLNRKDIAFQSIRELLDEIEEGLESRQIEPDHVWQTVVNTLYQDLLNKSREEDLKPFEWNRLWHRADKLHRKGLLERDEEVHQLHLRATPYPEKLKLLQKYKQPAAEIVALYRKYPDEPLNDEQVDIVFQALRTSEKDEELKALVERYPAEHRFAGMLAYYARQKKKKDETRTWGVKLLEYWVQNSQWDAALDFVKGKHLGGLLGERDAKAIRDYQWGKYEMDVPFIRLLSISKVLSQASTVDQNQISRYLHDTLLQKPDFFSKKLTVQQAGGALERAGKVMQCLEFYEMVFQYKTWPANEEEQQFARERWLVCKRRQLAITDRDDRKRQIRAEINTRAREWNVAMAHLPEYPNVDLDAKPKPVKPKAETKRLFSPDAPKKSETPHAPDLEELLKAPPPPISTPTEKHFSAKQRPELQEASASIIKLQFEANEQRFVCKLDRSRGKMTLQLYGEMEMVTLLAKGLSIQGSDEDFNAQIESVKHLRSRAEYFIRPWNVTCVMRTSRQKRQIVYVNLYLGQKEFELLSLRLAE